MMKALLRLVLVGANLVLLNMLLMRGGVQIDATEEGLHTLSDDLPALLQTLPKGSRLTFVASEGDQVAGLKPLVRQVQDYLRHFREAGGGRLEVEFIDPNQDTDKRGVVENQLGVYRFSTPTKNGGSAMVYFGLVAQVGTQGQVLTADDLVRPEGEARFVLHNFEGQVVRALNQVARRQQSLHAAVNVAGTVKMMPIFGDNLPDSLVPIKALVLDVLEDLKASYPDVVTIDQPNLNDEKFVAKLGTAGLRPWQFPDGNKAWFHLLVLRPSPGDGQMMSIEVPSLPYLKTAKDAREWIEQYILMSLDQGGRQLGLLLPPQTNERGQQRGRGGSGYEELLQLFNKDFQVKLLKPPLAAVPPGIDVMVVMGLPQADPDTVREIDKFVMRGGKLVLFASRAAFLVRGESVHLARFKSGFEPLLENWGLELHNRVGASTNGLKMSWPRRRLDNRVDFEPENAASPWTPVIPAGPDVAKDVLPLAGCEGIALSYPSPISASGNTRSLKVTPMLAGGSGSWASITADAIMPFDMQGEEQEPKRQEWDDDQPAFGVLLEGSFVHYQTPGITEDYVKPQSPSTRVAVIGDFDFLDRNFWAPQWRGLPTSDMISRLNDNQLFLRNLVDWAFGDDKVLKVSSRVARSRNIASASNEDKERSTATSKALGIPLAILFVIGLWRWRRRTAR